MKFFLPISLNLALWSAVGAWRYLVEERDIFANGQVWRTDIVTNTEALRRVAVCVPAHNEGGSLETTLQSLLQLVPPAQIFVASDGSTDATAAVARQHYCQVLELAPGRGKAAALEALLTHFSLLDRYEYVMIADADTVFDAHFLENALDQLQRNHALAVIFAHGYNLSLSYQGINDAAFFHAYRARLWYLLQSLLAYGQTWRRANVYSVVPGYANVYRSAVLRQLKIDVPGSVIEDFNLAFQIHKKHLGIIGHHPSVVAYTQDPTNFHDYWQQVLRWNIGFFQAVRRWKVWPSLFWASLGAMLLENIFIALGGFLIPTTTVLAVLISIPGGVSWHDSWGTEAIAWASWGLLGFMVIDYLTTLFVAWRLRHKEMILYGIGFIFFYYINSLIFLYAIPKALLTTSDGRWTSPQRLLQEKYP